MAAQRFLERFIALAGTHASETVVPALLEELQALIAAKPDSLAERTYFWQPLEERAQLKGPLLHGLLLWVRLSHHGSAMLHFLVSQALSEPVPPTTTSNSTNTNTNTSAASSTVLHMAVLNPWLDLDIFRQIARATVFDDRAGGVAAVRDAEGHIPLHLLARFCRAPHAVRAERAAVLLEVYPAGSRVATPRGELQQLALHLAVQRSDLSVPLVQRMLQEDPGSAAVADANGNLPLHVLLSVADVHRDEDTQHNAWCRRLLSRLFNNDTVSDAVIDFLREAQPGPEQQRRLRRQQEQLTQLTTTLLEAHPKSVDVAGQRRRLPLHMAAARGSSDTRLLLALLTPYPQAAQEVDDFGCLPLHLLVQNENSMLDTAAIYLLLDSFPAAIEAPDWKGRTPLHLAAKNPATTPAVFTCLLEGRGELALQADFDGDLPLHLMFNPHERCAPLRHELLAPFPDDILHEVMQRHSCGGDGPTLLQLAVVNPHIDTAVLDVLLRNADAGALAVRDEEGQLPFHAMVTHNVAATSELLSTLICAYPKAARVRGRHGRLPVHMAAAYRTSMRFEWLTCLCPSTPWGEQDSNTIRAFLSDQDGTGCTFLHHAVQAYLRARRAGDSGSVWQDVIVPVVETYGKELLLLKNRFTKTSPLQHLSNTPALAKLKLSPVPDFVLPATRNPTVRSYVHVCGDAHVGKSTVAYTILRERDQGVVATEDTRTHGARILATAWSAGPMCTIIDHGATGARLHCSHRAMFARSPAVFVVVVPTTFVQMMQKAENCHSDVPALESDELWRLRAVESMRRWLAHIDSLAHPASVVLIVANKWTEPRTATAQAVHARRERWILADAAVCNSVRTRSLSSLPSPTWPRQSPRVNGGPTTIADSAVTVPVSAFVNRGSDVMDGQWADRLERALVQQTALLPRPHFAQLCLPLQSFISQLREEEAVRVMSLREFHSRFKEYLFGVGEQAHQQEGEDEDEGEKNEQQHKQYITENDNAAVFVDANDIEIEIDRENGHEAEEKTAEEQPNKDNSRPLVGKASLRVIDCLLPQHLQTLLHALNTLVLTLPRLPLLHNQLDPSMDAREFTGQSASPEIIGNAGVDDAVVVLDSELFCEELVRAVFECGARLDLACKDPLIQNSGMDGEHSRETAVGFMTPTGAYSYCVPQAAQSLFDVLGSDDTTAAQRFAALLQEMGWAVCLPLAPRDNTDGTAAGINSSGPVPCQVFPFFALDGRRMSTADVRLGLTGQGLELADERIRDEMEAGMSPQCSRLNENPHVWVRVGRRGICTRTASGASVRLDTAFPEMLGRLLDDRLISRSWQPVAATRELVRVWADGAVVQLRSDAERTFVVLRHVGCGEASGWARIHAVDIYLTGSLHTLRDVQAFCDRTAGRAQHRLECILDALWQAVVQPALLTCSAPPQVLCTRSLRLGDQDLAQASPLIPSEDGPTQGCLVKGYPRELLQHLQANAIESLSPSSP